MLVSNIDQLPVQIVSSKVEVELTSYYQNRKGHICNLTKYISRLSVMIDRAEPVSSIKKIEHFLFKINPLNEQILLLLLHNKYEKRKSQNLCTEYTSRGSTALYELHSTPRKN